MNLHIKNKLFLVGGATSGFGKAITEQLVKENANVIAVARTDANLLRLQKKYPTISTVSGDLSDEGILKKILNIIGTKKLTGAIINSGGPPAMSATAAKLSDWDDAYRTVFRWKIALTQALLPLMTKNNYGRLLYIESVSTKQPVENLVLSNAMRLAVTGYVKTLSQEIGASGITLNILAPGYHSTPRMKNLFSRNSELKGISEREIRKNISDQTAVKKIGNPEDFASLAIWLLSSYSNYITGQTITVDGGLVKGTMG